MTHRSQNPPFRNDVSSPCSTDASRSPKRRIPARRGFRRGPSPAGATRTRSRGGDVRDAKTKTRSKHLPHPSFSRGLADERYEVTRYKSAADGGIRTLPADEVKSGGRLSWLWTTWDWGSGSILAEVYPQTREQHCWMHKTANVLDKLPRRIQGETKLMLHETWRSDTRSRAKEALERFLATWEAKYRKPPNAWRGTGRGCSLSTTSRRPTGGAFG